MTMGWKRAAIALLLAFAACGGKSENAARPESGAPDAGGPAPDAPTADPSVSIGAFDIRLVAAVPAKGMSAARPAYTAIAGKVETGPRPPVLQLDVTAQEGDCRLLVPTAPFCDPPCRGGACVTGGKCVLYPGPRNVGTVTATGLATEPGSAPVALPPAPPDYIYSPAADIKLAFPPFTEGADVTLSASGADLPAFTLAGKGINLLEVTSSEPIAIDKNQPMTVTWRAPARKELTRVDIALDISHHGGFKGEIICDTADSGSYTVSANLVTKLIELGVAGYPTVTLTRRASSFAQLPTGRVALNITSERILAVSIAGVRSCDEDDPCPAGQMCQDNKTCR